MNNKPGERLACVVYDGVLATVHHVVGKADDGTPLVKLADGEPTVEVWSLQRPGVRVEIRGQDDLEQHLAEEGYRLKRRQGRCWVWWLPARPQAFKDQRRHRR